MNFLEEDGIYYPQDYYVEEIKLIPVSGESIDLRKIMRELSIYEDIFSFAISGYVKIEDGIGIIDGLNLIGQEYLKITFGKVKDDPDMHSKTYKLYKIADRAPSGNFMTEYYTLHFCTEELLLSEKTKISKSYSGKQINDMVYEILTEQLEVPEGRINSIEDTMGIYDFVVPRFKPFEAISWLSCYARPSVGKGADMLFYETSVGYNFRSLQSLFKQPTFAEFLYQQKNISDTSFDETTRTIITFEFPKALDVMDEVSSGTYASKLISLDPLQRKETVTKFNYQKYEADTETSSLNGNPIANGFKDRFGKSLSSSYDSSLKLVTGNSKQSEQPYIAETEAGSKDIFIEQYVPNRTAQLSLATHTLLKIVVPGRTALLAGKVVEVRFPSIQQKNEGGQTTREEDKGYSGRYLVTALRHIVQPYSMTFQTILELAKDSSQEKMTGIDTSNLELDEIVAGLFDVNVTDMFGTQRTEAEIQASQDLGDFTG
jgi:hypothetical protein